MTAIDTSIRRRRSAPARAAAVRRPSVTEAQRSSILWAVEWLVRARGADQVDVNSICLAAGVSPAFFHAAFHDVDECLLVVFGQASVKAGAVMTSAYVAEEQWDAGVRGALCALLAFLDDRPGLARFLFVDSLWGSPALRARREELLSSLARALGRDRPLGPPRSSPAPYGPEAVVRAVASIVHARLQAELNPSLRDLHGALMAMILLPYLGAESARREIASVSS
jgi:hypothetical protein